MLSRIFVLALLFSLSSLSLPSLAEACACCDGGSTRRIVGWTPGGAALVEYQGTVACEPMHAYEVWRVGANRPSGCYDLFAEDAGARVNCVDLSSRRDDDRRSREERLAGADIRRAAFSSAVRVLRASDVRAEIRQLRPETLGTHARLVVSVRGADGHFSEVLRRPLLLGAVETHDGGQAMLNALGVIVFVDPSRSRALVRVDGHNTGPGIGHFPQDLFPAGLPAMADASIVIETIPTYALPSLTAAATSEEGGRDSNQVGLRAHRAGEFVNAAEHFAAAVAQNPRVPVYRTNLACAYARRGETESALAILETLFASRSECPRCAEALVRAARDEDLRALRTNPRFVVITSE